MRSRCSIAVAMAAVLFMVGTIPAAGITRAEVIGRAQRWVSLQVPYSQTSYFEGYRQDCSGMASMAWRLDRSYSTRTLAPNGVKISRDQLQPGDMLLKYDYHAAIFWKWADGDHSWYWTLEESGSQGGAVARLTRYPYWDVDGFNAYRRLSIVEIDDWAPWVTPVQGSNRYDTAVAASRLAFPSDTVTSAVVCSGEDWPDALGASALAGTLGGPILLTNPDSLPGAVAREIDRLGVDNVVIVGGTTAVSSAVQTSLDHLPGVTVSRIGGTDRYDTAARVASATIGARRELGMPIEGIAYVATGLDFADALGAATVSAHTGRPILLTLPGVVPSSTVEVLGELSLDHVFVAGGTSAIGDEVVSTLYSSSGVNAVDRVAGPDRYETAYALAEQGAQAGLVWDDVALATGENFADALAGAVMQAQRGSLLVLTPTDHLVPAADRAIREHMPAVDDVSVLGGSAAVGPLARRQIRWILDEPE